MHQKFYFIFLFVSKNVNDFPSNIPLDPPPLKYLKSFWVAARCIEGKSSPSSCSPLFPPLDLHLIDISLNTLWFDYFPLQNDKIAAAETLTSPLTAHGLNIASYVNSLIQLQPRFSTSPSNFLNLPSHLDFKLSQDFAGWEQQNGYSNLQASCTFQSGWLRTRDPHTHSITKYRILEQVVF